MHRGAQGDDELKGSERSENIDEYLTKYLYEHALLNVHAIQNIIHLTILSS